MAKIKKVEISKTDAKRIIKLLDDAARYFQAESKQLYIAGLSGDRMGNKARIMRQLVKKLSNKLS